MDAKQYQDAIAGTNEQRDVAAREVSHGFIVAGVRRFLDPNTGAVKLQQSCESVAASAEDAGAAAVKFLATGEF